MADDLLDPDSLAGDALDVARQLLGALLVREEVVLRIVEVEAYRWPGDTANHCRHGRTARNEPMWGPPGRAYVYLVYGMHSLLNVVTGPPDHGAAVLVRACEPVAGLDTVRSRRGQRQGPSLLDGPGKVGAALGLDPGWSGHALCEPGGLELRRGPPMNGALCGPRIGVGYADPEHVLAPWRLAVAGSPWVGHRRSLRPLEET